MTYLSQDRLRNASKLDTSLINHVSTPTASRTVTSLSSQAASPATSDLQATCIISAIAQLVLHSSSLSPSTIHHSLPQVRIKTGAAVLFFPTNTVREEINARNGIRRSSTLSCRELVVSRSSSTMRTLNLLRRCS